MEVVRSIANKTLFEALEVVISIANRNLSKNIEDRDVQAFTGSQSRDPLQDPALACRLLDLYLNKTLSKTLKDQEVEDSQEIWRVR